MKNKSKYKTMFIILLIMLPIVLYICFPVLQRSIVKNACQTSFNKDYMPVKIKRGWQCCDKVDNCKFIKE